MVTEKKYVLPHCFIWQRNGRRLLSQNISLFVHVAAYLYSIAEPNFIWPIKFDKVKSEEKDILLFLNISLPSAQWLEKLNSDTFMLRKMDRLTFYIEPYQPWYILKQILLDIFIFHISSLLSGIHLTLLVVVLVVQLVYNWHTYIFVLYTQYTYLLCILGIHICFVYLVCLHVCL